MVDKNSIFTFWSGRNIEPFEKIHPRDKAIFDRVGKRGHRLKLECLPCPIIGNLRTAPVVLLFLSPGYTPQDLKDAKTLKGRKHYTKRRTGASAVSADDPAAGWLSRIIKPLELNLEEVRKKVAVLNIGAYHSKRFYDYALLAALPSSRVSLDWAQNILFPQAMRGERVVICLRSAHFWGLARGKKHGRSLFAPKTNQGGLDRKSVV